MNGPKPKDLAKTSFICGDGCALSPDGVKPLSSVIRPRILPVIF